MRRRDFVVGTGMIGLSSLTSSVWAADSSSDPIRVGAFLPLQSGLAAGAKQVMDGGMAWVSHINDHGGVNGRKIEWIVENDSYSPQQTVAVARKLVTKDNVLAIVSPLGTATTLAAAPYLTKEGVPLINPIAGNAKLNAPKDHNIYSLLATSGDIGRAIGRHAVEKLNGKKIAILYQNDAFGKDPRDGATEEVKRLGSAIVAEATYVPSDNDMSAQMVTLKDKDPDVVLLFAITKHGTLFMREAEKHGWKPAVVAHGLMGDPLTVELGGTSIDGMRVILDTAIGSMDAPEVRQVNEVLAKYAPNTKPGYWPYAGIVGMLALERGLRRVKGELTRESLMQALDGFGSFDLGIVPPLVWTSSNHDGPKKFGFGQWRSGNLVVIEKW